MHYQRKLSRSAATRKTRIARSDMLRFAVPILTLICTFRAKAIRFESQPEAVVWRGIER